MPAWIRRPRTIGRRRGGARRTDRRPHSTDVDDRHPGRCHGQRWRRRLQLLASGGRSGRVGLHAGGLARIRDDLVLVIGGLNVRLATKAVVAPSRSRRSRSAPKPKGRPIRDFLGVPRLARGCESSDRVVELERTSWASRRGLLETDGNYDQIAYGSAEAHPMRSAPVPFATFRWPGRLLAGCGLIP